MWDQELKTEVCFQQRSHFLSEIKGVSRGRGSGVEFEGCVLKSDWRKSNEKQ